MATRTVVPTSVPDGGDAVDERLRALVERVARGDQAAMEDLHDATNRRVFGWCLKILGEPEAAEEAALDTYAQVWRQARRHDGSRGSVTTWLLTIARSRALDLRRARSRRTGPEESLEELTAPPPSLENPEQAAGEAERAGRVRKALEALPEAQRQVIEASFFGGLSHSEVARTLGQPLGTVKTRIRSGLTRLRETLAGTERELRGEAAP